MPNQTRILEAYSTLREQGRAAVLATIVHTAGSTYRKAGARLLVSEDGELSGLISGGCLEGNLIAEASRVLTTGRNRLLHFDMRADEEGVWGYALGCNGMVEILLQPLVPGTPNALDLIAESYREQRYLFLATALDEPQAQTRAVTEAELTEGYDGLLPHKLFYTSNHTTIIVRDGSRHFLERVKPPPRLLLLGAGADVEPLVRISDLLGWGVEVVDHRAAHVQRAGSWCDVPLRQVDPEQLPGQVSLDRVSAAIVISHHFPTDAIYLRHLLQTPIPYIAVLGPRERTLRLLDEIGENHPAHADRLYAPAGLDIGAESPEEIALSIVGEIETVLTGRSGLPLRDKPGGIHE